MNDRMTAEKSRPTSFFRTAVRKFPHALERPKNVLPRTAGRPLDPPTRSFMESRFGFDFRRVRIHDDSRAAESANAVNAAAFTVGNDVVFGKGRYDPGNESGRLLLAHELAHVVQQGGASGRMQRQPLAADPEEADDQLGDVIGLMHVFLGTLRSRSRESTRGRNSPSPYQAPISDLTAALGHLADLHASGTNDQKLLIARQFKSLLAQRAGTQARTNLPALQRKPLASPASDDPLEREADAAARQVAGTGSRTPDPPHISAGCLGSGSALQRQTGVGEGVLIGTGIAAGPPGWVILAVGAAVIAIGIGIAYVATRPSPAPEATPEETTVPKPPGEVIPIESHPKYRPHFKKPAPKPETPKPLGPDYYVDPRPEPKPKPEPEPRKRNSCFEANPEFIPCVGPRDVYEAAAFFLQTQNEVPDVDFSDLGECSGRSSFLAGDNIFACDGAPGENWHCSVNGTSKPLSIFGCYCCEEDGTSAKVWRGAHWSVGP
jgi:hypothetical protein